MKFRMLLALVPVIGAGIVYAAPSQAQATRTWVSGVGDDVNPCSRTAPCKTFAGAISKTAAKGEINCLDSGGFGTLTITKSIAVLCEGVVAGVLGSATNGFVINAATTDSILLSGINIEGGGSGLNGVRILQAGRVVIRNSNINGFQNGVVTPTTGDIVVSVENTTFSSNSMTGIAVNPAAGGTVRLVGTNVSIYGSPVGAVADASLTTLDARLTLKDSVISGSTTYGVQAIGSSGSARVFLDSNNISYNGVGIFANGSNTKIFALDNVISNNTTGVSAASGGQTNSYSNNALAGNSAGGTFTNTVLLQ